MLLGSILYRTLDRYEMRDGPIGVSHRAQIAFVEEPRIVLAVVRNSYRARPTGLEKMTEERDGVFLGVGALQERQVSTDRLGWCVTGVRFEFCGHVKNRVACLGGADHGRLTLDIGSLRCIQRGLNELVERSRHGVCIFLS